MATGFAVAFLELALADPAVAHVGGEAVDLGLPDSLLIYLAVGAVFLAVVVPVGRRAPRLRRLPVDVGSGHFGGAWAGAVLAVTVFVVAVAGTDASIVNAAPSWFYVVFWIGGTLLCLVAGDLWAHLNPFLVFVKPALPVEERPVSFGRWPAAVGMFGFVWILLVYPDRAEPRGLAALMLAYVSVVIAAGAYWGQGVTSVEVFTVWFRHVRGAADVDLSTAAVALVVLGAALYDGVAASSFWADVAGSRSAWEQVPVATIGLTAAVAVTALAWWVATIETARRLRWPAAMVGAALGRALFPLAGILVVVHGSGLLVFEGQTTVALLSDPLGRGWDLLGTAKWVTDYELVTPEALTLSQIGGVVLGHVVSARVARAALSSATSGAGTVPRAGFLPIGAFLAISAAGGVALLLL
jgi:hypothetical protein